MVNIGPLIPEFTLIIWQPFRRQIGEIGEIGETPTFTVAFLHRFPPKSGTEVTTSKCNKHNEFVGVKTAPPFPLLCPQGPEFRGANRRFRA